MDVLVAVIIVVAVVLSSFRHHPEPAERARALRRAGMIFMTLSIVSMGLFVSLQDPGGWAWAGAIVAALVPLGAVATLAWCRPELAVPLLAALTVIAVVGVAVDGDLGRIEGIGAVTTFALVGTAVGATALGHHRARAAGLMLLAIGLAPIVIGVQTVYMAPAVASGALLVLADRLSRRPPGTGVGAPDPDPPREAAWAARFFRLSARIVLVPPDLGWPVMRW